jgi:glutathione peroxidase
MGFYDIKVKNSEGMEVSMSEYRGKVILVVNTATGCGFTPQYEELEELYKRYKDQGFVILDFPCNQFGNQAPGNISEIHEFCQLKYNTTFPLFEKVEVNGANQSELFKYLKAHSKSLFNSSVKWNFTKFLVSKEGKVVKRYSPMTKPSKIENKIKSLI